MAKFRTKLFFVIFAFFVCIILYDLIYGIVRHSDYLSVFHFTGKITDKNGFDIKQVKVFFVDRGFDNYLPANDSRKIIVVGFTDMHGNLDQTFDYFWGHKSIIVRTSASKKFDVLLSKKSYKSKILSFDGTVLPKKDNIIQVELGRVALEKEEK